MTVIANRRWFRFSLRTLLIAILLVAWSVYTIRWLRARHSLVDGCRIVGSGSTAAPGMLWLFGEPGIERLEVAFPNNPEEIELTDDQRRHLQHVRRVFPESTVVVVGMSAIREIMEGK